MKGSPSRRRIPVPSRTSIEVATFVPPRFHSATARRDLAGVGRRLELDGLDDRLHPPAADAPGFRSVAAIRARPSRAAGRLATP